MSGKSLVRLRDAFAPSGVLRAAINLGNPVIAQPDPGGGEPRGVGPAIAREIGARLGVAVEFRTYETAAKAADALKSGEADVSFLAIDPERSRDLDFTDPYVLIEGTFMVRSDSPLARPDDVDRDGIQVAVGARAAYDLHLTRTLKRATLVRAESSRAAIERFLSQRLDAVAGVRQQLLATAATAPALRVMTESFMVIRQAAAVARGRDAAREALAAFIEEAKRSGWIARALAESGVEASVAPPAG